MATYGAFSICLDFPLCILYQYQNRYIGSRRLFELRGFYSFCFLYGFFSRHITEIVCFIAFCQLLIAVGFTTKEKMLVWSGWGAIIFLVSIAPLGAGSGFPSTLILALAVYMIIRKPVRKHLWEFAVRKPQR